MEPITADLIPGLPPPVHAIDNKDLQLSFFGSKYAELLIKDNILITAKMAREMKRTMEAAYPCNRYYLLVGGVDFFRVTKEARRLGADPVFSSHLAAVACYTTNPSLMLLGELYNKINKPAVTTRIFTLRETARQWLFDQMVGHGN